MVGSSVPLLALGLMFVTTTATGRVIPLMVGIRPSSDVTSASS
jgi:hypothetical protein